MGPIGVQEMIAIFVIALVLFGPKKLPELGRMLGKGLSEFRRAKSELKATFESHLSELERETRASDSSISTSALPSANYSAPQYSYPYEDQGTWETGNSSEVVPSLNGASHASNESATVHAIEPPSAPELAPAPAVAGAVPRGKSSMSEEHSA